MDMTRRLLLLAIMASAIDATIAADFAKDGVGGLSIGVASGKELITTPARRQSHVALRAAPAPRQ